MNVTFLSVHYELGFPNSAQRSALESVEHSYLASKPLQGPSTAYPPLKIIFDIFKQFWNLNPVTT